MSLKNQKTRPDPSWEQVYSAYEQCLEAPAEERLALAESLCAGSAELLEEVRFLLNSTEPAKDFLERPAAAQLAQVLAPHELKAGDTVEDYRIEAILGKGAFATVYRARQISLDREVALKVSPNFGQEGRTIAQLDHEGIVPVFSQSTIKARNLRIIAMQLVPGVNLEELEKRLAFEPALSGEAFLRCLDKGQGAPASLTADGFRDREWLAGSGFAETVAWLGIRLANALAHAHSLGILHLDVKPSNILMAASARPKLTDFNVSSDTEALSRGLPEQFGGTFDYMSPEHRAVFDASDKAAAARELDARADIYSLGVVLKRMLALDKHRREEEIDWILNRAVASDPTKRYVEAAALARALEGYLELKTIRAGIPQAGWLGRQAARSPLATLTLLGALPQMAAGAFGIAYNSTRIVRELNPMQQELFRNLNYLYNPILYVLASLVWAYGLMRIFPVLRKPQDFISQQHALADHRACALRLPLLGCFITTLGWIPGLVLFPACLHYLGGGLSPTSIGHFVVAFVLAYGIALAYSFLFHEWVVLRAIYPLYFPGCEKVADTASKELRAVPKNVRAACVMASFIPLVGAIVLILVGPDKVDLDDYRMFRSIAATLIFMGAAGVSCAFAFAQQIARTIVRFTSPKRQISDDKK